MRQILYSSLAARPYSEAEIREMAEHFGAKNKSLGVTGLFSYQGITFTQVIEGEDEQVRSLYEQIRRDPRHKHVFTLIDRQLRAREFPDWTMHAVDEGRLKDVDGELFQARQSDREMLERGAKNAPDSRPGPNSGLAYQMMVALRDELRRIRDDKEQRSGR